MLEGSLDSLLGLGRITQSHTDFLRGAPCLCQTLSEAFAAQFQRRVTNLLVDAERMLDTSRAQLLTTANASLFLGLSDVDQHS
jgi:hypothetical protein